MALPTADRYGDEALTELRGLESVGSEALLGFGVWEMGWWIGKTRGALEGVMVSEICILGMWVLGKRS